MVLVYCVILYLVDFFFLLQVTLSSLLNFIDELWSSCGDEIIIIFTTNHIEKLNPALLRPGRMDVHIHMGVPVAGIRVMTCKNAKHGIPYGYLPNYVFNHFKVPLGRGVPGTVKQMFSVVTFLEYECVEGKGPGSLQSVLVQVYVLYSWKAIASEFEKSCETSRDFTPLSKEVST
ncbi:hypothetical protein MTR67_011492 [Solanum verrucosum]|uniref:ATPase AAA-type core domain-containing protein n=1 Tax=Solanum verrucosum TaxID=315347 RepID=A0AAF0Q852_SOLVR|nr:hypothetical protein MTR67_011492 [Solanum verrucosum]